MSKAWEANVREQGCIITGRNDVQIHHVVGRSYKHNKVLIGPWFILPLCWYLHDVHSNSKHNVTHFRHNFTRVYGFQRDLFANMVKTMQNQGYEVPETTILQAISETDR